MTSAPLDSGEARAVGGPPRAKILIVDDLEQNRRSLEALWAGAAGQHQRRHTAVRRRHPAVAEHRVVADHEISHGPRDIVFSHEGETLGFWDEDRLFQVLANLIGNALEHGRKDAPVAVRLDGTGREDRKSVV